MGFLTHSSADVNKMKPFLTEPFVESGLKRLLCSKIEYSYRASISSSEDSSEHACFGFKSKKMRVNIKVTV
jgi:hypothetical protein